MPTTDRAAQREARADQHVDDPVRQYLDAIGQVGLLTAEDEVELAQRIEAGLYAEELLRRADEEGASLDGRDRSELEQLVEMGRDAKDRMVQANLRLVVAVARKFSRDLPLLDVVQEGNLGLIRAVEKFDYVKGFKFSTYATWWIRQAIQRALPEQTRTVRLPAHVAESVSAMRRMERRLGVQLGRDATAEEVATELGLSAERVGELRDWDRRPVSLDAPVGDETDGATVGDLLERPDETEVSTDLEADSFRAAIRGLLDLLTEREARIMTMRFGLDGHEPRTLAQVGEVLGLTRERVRQLEKHALADLREPGRRTLADWAA